MAERNVTRAAARNGLSQPAVSKALNRAAPLLAITSTAVLAADMPVKAPAAPAHNWTGCYVGVNGGGAVTSTVLAAALRMYSARTRPVIVLPSRLCAMGR